MALSSTGLRRTLPSLCQAPHPPVLLSQPKEAEGRAGRKKWICPENSPNWSTGWASAFLNIWQQYALNINSQKCDFQREGKSTTR